MNRFYLLLGVLALAGAAVLAYLVLGRKPVSIPANVMIQPADTAGFRGYVLGQPTAPIEVTEYADYQCPACGNFENIQFPDVKSRLIDAGKIRWRYRDFPLNQHPHARVAAHAAACADDQGKFWQMHRLIYEAQDDWSNKRDASGDFRDFAKAAGVDLGKYDTCMTTAAHAGRIQASSEEGNKVGVQSTPTLLIGGRLYAGVMPYDELKRIVDSLASAAPAAPAPAPAK